MKKRKLLKFLSLILAVSLTMPFIGCNVSGKNSEETEEELEVDSDEEEDVEEEEETPEYTMTDMEAVYVASTTASVRSLPENMSERLGSLEIGEEVTVTGVCNENGWYRIAWEDGEGFVYGPYLSNADELKQAFEELEKAEKAEKDKKKKEQEAKKAEEQNKAQEKQETQENESNQEPVKAAPAQAAPSQGYDATMARAAFDLANQKRAEVGAAPLAWNDTIAQACNVRAAETVTSFSHTRPDGTSCFTALTQAGYNYYSCGENIAYGYSSAASVVDGWYNSPGHKANMLNTGFTSSAVGCYCVNGRYYWVQLFGNP